MIANEGLKQHDQPWPVRKQRLEFDPVDQLRDAVLHVVRTKNAVRQALDVGVREAVAGELHCLVRDHRHGLSGTERRRHLLLGRRRPG